MLVPIDIETKDPATSEVIENGNQIQDFKSEYHSKLEEKVELMI